MRLPDPVVALTLPSLYDETILSIRVYHPPSWRRRDAAVVAHPYAPMGGDYNNHVVGTVVACLLQAGFIVATFNFR
jgi:alpha/beta superfamily hydrolase